MSVTLRRNDPKRSINLARNIERQSVLVRYTPSPGLGRMPSVFLALAQLQFCRSPLLPILPVYMHSRPALPEGRPKGFNCRSSDLPSISVLMPVHNAGPFLQPSIQSILQQSFTDLELVIVNDGSSDGSDLVIEQLVGKDSRAVVIHQAQQGIVAALNKAVQVARAPFLARMDADDVALPGRLAAQHAALKSNRELAVIGGHVEIIDSAGRYLYSSFAPMGPREIAKAVRTYCPLTHSAVMMRRAALDNIGGYRSHYESAEDYDLWLRLLDAGYRIDNLNRMVLQYRIHGAGISQRRRAQQAVRTIMARIARGQRLCGVPELAPPPGVEDANWLRTLPMSLRPCEHELLEAELGMPCDVATEDLLRLMQELSSIALPIKCRAGTARLLAQAGIVMLRRGHGAYGIYGLMHALRRDPLVVPRQLGAAWARRAVRVGRRLRYLASGESTSGPLSAARRGSA